WRTRCAQCTASAVLPTPPAPVTTPTTVDGVGCNTGGSQSSRTASDRVRPVKSATSAGSCAGTGRGSRSAPGSPSTAGRAASGGATAGSSTAGGAVTGTGSAATTGGSAAGGTGS